MFKKHWPKFIPTFVLLFFFLAGFIYRGITYVPLNKKVVAQFPHYSIMELDGKYYLRMNEIDEAYPNEMPTFSSVEQMRNRILNGELTSGEVVYIFDKNTNNIDYEHDLLITDPIRPINPTFEMDVPIQRIEWTGFSYTYYLPYFNLNIHASEDQYQKYINQHYRVVLNVREDNLINKETDSISNITTYYYKGYPSMLRRYELQTKAGMIDVVERYGLTHDSLEEVCFFGYCDNIYFSGNVNHFLFEENQLDINAILQAMDIVTNQPN